MAPTLRAGAWYPVVGESGESEVCLEVGSRRVAVSRRFLDLRPSPPAWFSVVAQPRTVAEREAAGGAYADPGSMYVVCPRCARRLPIYGAPPVAACPSCGHRGEVGWHAELPN